MFVRQLIGRQAGQIIEMPYHAAEACLAQGSAERVTDAEILAAGLTPEAPVPVAELSITLPDGFEAHARPDGLGFDLYRSPVTRDDKGEITSEPLNAAPLHNLIAARDAAVQLVEPPAPAGPVDIPEGWEDLKAEPMKALAVALGADPEPTTKAEAVAFIEAEIARRADAAAQAEAAAQAGGGGEGAKTEA